MSSEFRDKKILILGLGLNQGGVGAAKFFVKAGAKVRVTDLKSKEQLKDSVDQLKDFDIEYTLGEHKYEDIDWADLIIRNPALKPENPYRIYAEKSGKEVEMDMGIFLQYVNPKQVIGVTGTKGKSTTATVIYKILKNTNEKVVFAGNIGKSVLDTIPFITPDILVVLELSSFQLEAWDKHKVSPHIAVITNIYPDHLNYYPSFEDYIESKKLIAKHQDKDDFLFLAKDSEILNNSQFTSDLNSQIILFSKDDLPSNIKTILLGQHNLSNFAAAFSVAKTVGVSENKALKIIEGFRGVEFRLQLIKQIQGIKIYNDTAATTPDAAIHALKTFPNSILICGGVNKNLPYQNLAKAIDQYADSVYFLEGDATEEIKKYLGKKDKVMGTFNNLHHVVQIVKQHAKPGDVILFSPGAASFNLFQNEFDRGRKFNEAVEKVFG